jgi:acetoin utilization protein AcuA
MIERSQQTVMAHTSKGEVAIKSFCTPEDIRACTFDSQFVKYARYKSLYTKRESLEKAAAGKDANVVLALAPETHIIGFGVLAYPHPEERWHKVGPEVMMEIAALEVCRSWRRAKLAKNIASMLLTHPQIEDKIIYFVGYAWTWDLEGTRLSAQEYRTIIIKVFQPYNFRIYQTNEPNICLKAENIFMARIGKNITPDLEKKFKWVRFNIDPSTLT